jgi:hypothetical protein
MQEKSREGLVQDAHNGARVSAMGRKISRHAIFRMRRVSAPHHPDGFVARRAGKGGTTA